jgi:hydroxypyruvate reductase
MVSLSSVKTTAKTLLSAALDAVDPYQATSARFRRKGNIIYAGKYRYGLSQFNRIYVIGAGKAACGMARAVEKTIGDWITAGIIAIPHGYHCAPPLRRIMIIKSGHPVLDAAGVRAALKAKSLLESVTGNDLVIYLASGGGSALMTLPAPGITLKDLQQTTQLLLESGAPMPQINCIRKHLDLLKGGQLIELIYPAIVITFVLSDIIGDRLDMVGGGPTLPDPTTFKDAYNILAKYRLWRKIPGSVRRRIKSGLAGGLPETPKPGHHAFRKSHAILIGSNRTALDAMVREAKSLGLNCIIRAKPVTGEARLIAQRHARMTARLSAQRKKPILWQFERSELYSSSLNVSELLPGIVGCNSLRSNSRTIFILSGGETTVTIKSNDKACPPSAFGRACPAKSRPAGQSRGGRNQEYALAFGLEMERLGFNKYICLSAGTDGRDYIRQAAGAMVDGFSLSRARELGLNPEQLLRAHDSYRFHKPVGTLIKIPPGRDTNVNDVQIAAVW